MKKYLNEILTLLGSDKKKLPWLVLLFFLISFLDIAGIGLIGPYVSLVIDPDSAKGMLDKHLSWFEMSNETNLLLIFSLALILIFFTKTISGIWINSIIIRFSLDQRLRLMFC